MRLIAVAIVVAGALVAANIAVTSHYSITGTGNHATTVFRLNNWTGEVTLCMDQITATGSFSPKVNCRTELTDAEVGVKDDWVRVPNASPDQFGGVRVERNTK